MLFLKLSTRYFWHTGKKDWGPQRGPLDEDPIFGTLKRTEDSKEDAITEDPREEPKKDPKEDHLNRKLCTGPWRGPIQLRSNLAKQATKNKY